MRKTLSILALLFCSLAVHAQEDRDFSALGSKLEEYVRTLETETPETRHQECDYLIASCKDSLVKQYVSVKLYDLFLHSRMMGAEESAVYIVDRYFSSGEVKMYNEMDLFAAELFAEYNRSSLLGCRAPSLEMEDSYGAACNLFASGGTGRFTVLYFYDTTCTTCKLMTPRLTRLLESRDEDIDVYPVYGGDDYSAWMKYIAANFASERYHNLWDPSMSSDFQIKYGVLSTPKLFLINPDGIIIGRGLDPDALSLLLDSWSPAPEDNCDCSAAACSCVE